VDQQDGHIASRQIATTRKRSPLVMVAAAAFAGLVAGRITKRVRGAVR
jgi:hypothetical protein